VSEPGPEDLGAVIFICVGTPTAEAGSPDLRAIFAVCQQIAQLGTTHKPVIAIRSTVPPGTIDQCQALVGDAAVVCSNPEFMREGNAVDDFFNPPYILIGRRDGDDVEVLQATYESVDAEIVQVGVREAEMIKYVSNSWHAVKVAFANEIGTMAKMWNAESPVVMDLFCRDARLNLSRAYLRPGAPFGGSCLPKDLRSLAAAARRSGVEAPLLNSVMISNEAHLARCLDLVNRPNAGRIAWLGLAFKDNTDDLRESPALKLFHALLMEGRDVHIFDPVLSGEELIGVNRKVYEQNVLPYQERLRPDLDSCLEGVDLAVLFTRDDDVVHRVMALPETVAIVDLVNDSPICERANYSGL
jgi:GDP-mannose 6-dehydrogenase